MKVHPQYEFDCPKLGFRVFVDGVKIITRLVPQQRLNKGFPIAPVQGIHERDYSGSMFLKPFSFSAIGICKDPSSP